MFPALGPALEKSLNDPQMQGMLSMSTNSGTKIAEDLFVLLISALILWGALRMLKLRSFEFAMVAAILALIPCFTPCPCCILGLPFGIWALVALRKPGVKDCFH